jgi:hypothetical protein
VPRHDDHGGAKIRDGAEYGQIRHQLEIVEHKRVVVEVVRGRLQAVEAAIGGEPSQPISPSHMRASGQCSQP